MDKKDLATVLVRFAGVYFAYLAVKKIAGIAYAVWLFSFILSDSGDGFQFHEKLSLSTAVPGAIAFFISAGIAYYLLWKGSWLIAFLSKDPSDKPNEA